MDTALIKAALLRRLSEVRLQLEGRSPCPPPVPAVAYPTDPEERLRQFMVNKRPGCRPGDSASESSFFALIFSLGSEAIEKDWRYLDAWNNAYEVQAGRALRLREEAALFYCYYAFILEARIEQLCQTNAEDARSR